MQWHPTKKGNRGQNRKWQSNRSQNQGAEDNDDPMLKREKFAANKRASKKKEILSKKRSDLDDKVADSKKKLQEVPLGRFVRVKAIESEIRLSLHETQIPAVVIKEEDGTFRGSLKIHTAK